MGVNWTQPFPSFRGKRKEGEERGKRERRRIRGGREWGEKKEENHRRAEGERKEQSLYFNRSKFPLSSFHQHHKNLFIVLNESILQLTINVEQNQKSKWNKIIFCTIFPQNYFSSSCPFSVEYSADFPSTTHQAAYLHGEALLPLVSVFSLSQEQPPSKGASPWILCYSPILYSELSLLFWTKGEQSYSLFSFILPPTPNNQKQPRLFFKINNNLHKQGITVTEMSAS